MGETLGQRETLKLREEEGLLLGQRLLVVLTLLLRVTRALALGEEVAEGERESLGVALGLEEVEKEPLLLPQRELLGDTERLREGEGLPEGLWD